MTPKGMQGKGLNINKRYLVLVGIVVILAALFSIITDSFLSFDNMMNIVRQTSILAIVSVGMTFVILTGNIDLSIPNNIALSGVLAGLILQGIDSPLLAIAATIGSAMVVGYVNGFLVGRCKLNAFIATLATNTVLGGIAVLLTAGKGIAIANEAFLSLGRADLGPFPVPLLFVVAIFVIFIFVNKRTSFGKRVYAVGGNSAAARASGINVERNIEQVYVLCGFLVGVAAVLNTGRLGSAQPYAGDGMDFDAITAVVLGGTSLIGGLGGVAGTVIGSLLMGVITNGLDMMQYISQYYIFIIKGILILVTVGVDLLLYRRNEKRLTPTVAESQTTAQEEPDIEAKLASSGQKLLQMQHIVKAYPGMKALDDVSLEIRSGEVLALMGENGAGKSTLMQILLGENKKSAGSIAINGKYVDISSPRKAEALGIAMIHQENALVQSLTVAENMFLGREISNRLPAFINKGKMRRRCRETLKKVKLEIPPGKKVRDLTVSQQQLVEIAKALYSDAWLLVMDEPTSSLTEDEKDTLFALIRQLKAENKAVIYISHRMQEIYEIADRVTVLRDGKLVGSAPLSQITEDQLIQMMVGRSLSNVFDRQKNEPGEMILEVEGLTKKNLFHDVSFAVGKGEVLGLCGLIGAGRTEVMKCIFGFYPPDQGEIRLEGQRTRIKNVKDAMRKGIAYLTEDRKREGFVPYMSIEENLAMPSYRELSNKLGIVSRGKSQALAEEMIEKLDIRTTSRGKNVVELSGGNQQKVSLGKWLARDLKVLILDEPTRGIDIGSKAEIHKIIGEIAKSGIAVILISSEMPELIGCADRILVMKEGGVSGVVDAGETDQNELMRLAAL